MANGTIGDQYISLAYGEEGRAIKFNRINFRLHPTGVYWGGGLSVESVSEIGVEQFVVFLQNTATAIGIKIQTNEKAVINIDEANPFVIVRMQWVEQYDNYADILAVDYDSITSEDIILGRGIFENGDLVDVDETYKQIVENDSLKSDHLPFRIKSDNPISNSVIIQSGTVKLYDTVIEVPETTVTLSDTVDGRHDLIYLDRQGVVQVLEGTDSTTPSTPDYAGEFVIGEIHRGANRTTVYGSDIVNLDTDVIYSYFPGIIAQNGTLLIESLTPNRLVSANSDKELVSSHPIDWILPTTNQINVVDQGDGTVTLELSNTVEINNLQINTLQNTSNINTPIAVNSPIESISSIEASLILGDTVQTDTLESKTIPPEGEEAYISVLTNLEIFGNIIARGTFTAVDRQQVQVSDNVMLLNRGEVSSGVTAGYAGIEIDRGTSDPYTFVFNETQGNFRVGAIITERDTAQDGGTTTSIILAEDTDHTDTEFYNGKEIFIKSGTGEGQTRLVPASGNNWDNTTKELTVASEWDEDSEDPGTYLIPDSTSDYWIKLQDDTQAVATRENSPVDSSATFWNSTTNRLETDSNFIKANIPQKNQDNSFIQTNTFTQGIVVGEGIAPVAGAIRWNAVEEEFQGYDGTEWGPMGGGEYLRYNANTDSLDFVFPEV